MRYRVLCSIIGLCCLMVSCSPWQDSYFDNGIGELRQQDVKDKLGKPHLVDDPHLSDETTWKYRYVLSESDLDPVGLKSLGKEAGSMLGGPDAALREKVYCFVYVLTFDKEAVLRTWDREICQVPNPPNLFEQSQSGN